MSRADGAGPSHRPAPIEIAICVCTYRRARGLRRLLDAVALLELPEVNDVSLRLVVVDNDADASASAVVSEARSALSWPVVYEVEPEQGIPFARNRAVRAAGAVEFVAFIDDDEVPEARWLSELLRVQRETGSDVVHGPVLPVFEVSPPRWILTGGFFDRPRFATGMQTNWATTSNVLIATRVFEAIDPPFSIEMRYTGGSDTHFFMRAHDLGFCIVWADEARVSEVIPATRLRARWLLAREYRRGNTLSLCLRDLHDSWWRRARRAGHVLVGLVQGVMASFFGITKGRAGVVRGLQRICFAAGMASGLLGVRFEEYRVLHGS